MFHRPPGRGRLAVLPAMVVAAALAFAAHAQAPAGKVRPLAVTSRQRMSALPDLPTVAESGVPGFVLDQWYGVVTTAKVPRAVVNKLGAGVAAAVKAPEVEKRLTVDGSTPVGSTPEQFMATIKADIARWSKLIQDIGLAKQ